MGGRLAVGHKPLELVTKVRILPSQLNMISIVIPAFNEEDNIIHCLNAFLKQTTKRQFEIILVDNASTDRTFEIAKQFANKLNINVISDPIKGRGHARYTGFKNALGNIILSSDADTIVPDEWIEKLASALANNPEIIAVTTPCKIIDCDEKTNRIFNRFQPFVMRIFSFFFGYYWLNGFSFGIRKDAYIKSGGFDLNLNAQEDIDLSFRVSKIGKILFLPNISVIFSGRRFKKGLIKGLWSYLSTFLNWYWGKKKNLQLDDVR